MSERLIKEESKANEYSADSRAEQVDQKLKKVGDRSLTQKLYTHKSQN